MERTCDQRTYEKRHYKLRMIGGPYDGHEAPHYGENAPPIWCWAGLPAEFSTWANVKSFFEPTLSPDPGKVETCIRVEYHLEGVWDCGTWRIAVYSWSDPRVLRRFRIVEDR